jgi:hypothetical protein
MLQNIIFVTLFFTIPILWLYLLRLASIQLEQISIPGILTISFILFQYLGFAVLFFELSSNRARTINDQTIIFEVFLLSSITITLVIAGFVIARKIFGSISKETRRGFQRQNLRPSNGLERVAIIVMLLVGVAALIRYIEVVGFSKLAIAAALKIVETSTSTEVLRSEMGNNFSGRYHWYRFFMRDVLQIATMAQFAVYLLSKRLFDLMVFSIAAAVTTFSMITATEKGPLIYFMLGLLMVYLTVHRAGLLSKRSVFLGAPLLLILVGFLYTQFMGSPDLLKGIENGLARTLTGQMVGAYHYVQIFPEKVDYLLGRSFPNPGGMFPWEPYSVTVEVMNIVNPSGRAAGVVGSMPTFFWGEMYANFGYFGVMIPPVFVGISLYWFNLTILCLPMRPVSIGFFVWFALHFIGLSGTGLSGFILNVTGALMLLALFLCLFISGRGVLKFNRVQITG